jgi:hypothetical protein
MRSSPPPVVFDETDPDASGRLWRRVVENKQSCNQAM